MEPLDLALLDGWQRDFPLVERPFAVIGQALSLTEDEVLSRLTRLAAEGHISRLGATVRPQTAGASTLCAMAVPEARIETVAAAVSEEPGVNHSYLREDLWNLWFVATAPDAEALTQTLTRLRQATGLTLLDLPILRPFNIDLGFRLTGPRRAMTDRKPKPHTLSLEDRALCQALSKGLPLTERPFTDIPRMKTLLEAGILTRIGLILRHRSLGYTSNAMVVWDLPEDAIPTAGPKLAALPGISLCYERRPAPQWPYRLYSMIHARSRPEALETLAEAEALIQAHPRPLFSTRCFKQTGALVAA